MSSLNTIHTTFDMIRSIRQASNIKSKRGFDDFFADRIVQSAAEPTLTDFIERLAKTLNVQQQYISHDSISGFLEAVNNEDADQVLEWIRIHPRVSAMIAGIHDKSEYITAIGNITLPESPGKVDWVKDVPQYDVNMKVKTLSPLSHGSDEKAGNATLFRRRKVITESGRILYLPFYSGNAIRGQVRDLLADDLLRALDLMGEKPRIKLWFFHMLYSGGALSEDKKNTLDKELGKAGALRTEGLRRFREMIPMLSLLGTASGSRIISGRLNFGDLRPVCREWGTGERPVAEMMEWTFFTRREDNEDWEDGEHSGMIVNVECLTEGVELVGGIDMINTNDIEKSALARGLLNLQQYGKLGGENRRGLGMVEINFNDLPEPTIYDNWLEDHKQDVINYLMDIGAIDNE